MAWGQCDYTGGRDCAGEEEAMSAGAALAVLGAYFGGLFLFGLFWMGKEGRRGSLAAAKGQALEHEACTKEDQLTSLGTR